MHVLTKYILIGTLLLNLTSCSIADKILESNKVRVTGDKIAVNKHIQDLRPDQRLSTVQFPAPKGACNPQLSESMRHKKVLKFHGSRTFPLVSKPIVSSDQLILMDARGLITSFDKKSGQQRWAVQFGEKPSSSRLLSSPDFFNGGLLYHDKLIFATAGRNEVRAIRADSGQLVWKRTLISPSRSVPVIHGDKLLIQTADNNLYALHKDTGEIIWLYIGISEAFSMLATHQPVIYKNYVLIQQTTGEIIALDLKDGSESWVLSVNTAPVKLNINQHLQSSLANMQLDQHTLIVKAGGGMLVAFDLQQQKVKWEKNLSVKGEAYICGDLLYVVSADDHLLAISKLDGRTKWVQDLSKYSKNTRNNVSWTAPVMAGSHVIVMSSKGQFLWFNWNVGQLEPVPVGFTKLYEHSVSLPPIIDDGSVYVIYDIGELHKIY